MLRIEIIGYNHERLLNRINGKGIAVFDVVKKRDRIFLSFFESDFAEIIDLCNDLCYTLGKQTVTGKKRRTRFLLSNTVVILGFVLAIVACVFQSGRVGKILLFDESGLTSETELFQVLELYGVYEGAKLSELDTDYLENQLALRIKGSEYVLISVYGRDISVTVTARSKPIEPLDKAEGNLVAVRDGVVTRIVDIVGTAQVKVGDRVSVGQTLIKGCITYNDGTESTVRAEGRVYATVSVTADVTFIPYRETYELTGNSFTVTEYDVLGHRVRAIQDVPFEIYETIEYKTVLSPAPIKRIRVVYNELKAVRIDISFDEALPSLKQKAEEYVREKADFDIEHIELKEMQEGDMRFLRAEAFGTVVISDYPK